jgi:predicted pyridoxine 5'-phosphate oxidase superfamily flavin-nucleotide-binding protein
MGLKDMLSKKVTEFFEEVPVMALATADKYGNPNVSAIASKKIIDQYTIWTIDTFHNKTLENIKENEQVSIAMWKDSEGYQIKGIAKHYTEGDIFERGKEWILKTKPQKIVKGVIEKKVSKVFYMTPKYELAGKEI